MSDVHMTVSTKNAVFRDVTTCSLVEIYDILDKCSASGVKAVGCFETSYNSTTPHSIIPIEDPLTCRVFAEEKQVIAFLSLTRNPLTWKIW